MFVKILDFIKGINNYVTILIIIGVGIFTLLYDGQRYKEKGFIKELRIIKIISYSYMGIGAVMFLLLLIM